MDGKKKDVVISERLRALAGMVTPGNVAADIGCDHGFLPIYLVQKGICPRALAMDVRRGPLSRAEEHIAAYGLEEYIETRLSDGLDAYRDGEAQTCVCAGMGGRLMQKILTEGSDKAKGFGELILQPQSELAAFRRFLRKSGYHILQENILCEEDKYYFLMKVCPKTIGETAAIAAEFSTAEPSDEDCKLWDRYGRGLLESRHPVLKRYLEDSLRIAEQVKEAVSENENERAGERLAQVGEEIVCLNRALALYGPGQ